jgi:hypothetical protein
VARPALRSYVEQILFLEALLHNPHLPGRLGRAIDAHHLGLGRQRAAGRRAGHIEAAKVLAYNKV